MISPDSSWYVTGRVIDSNDEYPLIGANVILRYNDPDHDSLHTCGVATNEEIQNLPIAK